MGVEANASAAELTDSINMVDFMSTDFCSRGVALKASSQLSSEAAILQGAQAPNTFLGTPMKRHTRLVTKTHEVAEFSDWTQGNDVDRVCRR